MSAKKCSECGGVLANLQTLPVVCTYCGAEQALPPLAEGQVHLTNDSILGLLRSRLAGVDSTFLHPSIPQKKMANVRRTHAAHLPPDEYVVGLYDGTAFGSAKDGFLVTVRGLYWKNQLEQPGFIAWADIDPDECYTDESDIVLGRLRLGTLYGPDDEGLWEWTDTLSTLARSARPGAAAPAAYEDPADRPPAAGWGGPEVAVTRGEGWGGTASAAIRGGQMIGAVRPDAERFARAPYPRWSECSLVDVHASGEIFLAGGRDVIELRYTQNGGRYLTVPTQSGIMDARFSPDGAWLLVADMDGRASVYDVRTGSPQGATPKMSDYCDQVAWLGSDRFAMASQAGEVQVVDAGAMRAVHTLLEADGRYDSLGGIAASADGSRLFVSLGGRVGAFDTNAGQILWRVDDALTNASRLAVSPDGATLVAAGYDGLALFDGQTGAMGARCAFPCAQNVCWPEEYEDEGMFGRTKKVMEEGFFSWSPRPRFSPTGEALAVNDHVGNLCFLDMSTLTLTSTAREQGRAWIEDVAWFQDGNHLALGMSDNSFAVWSARPLTGILHARALGD